MYPMSGESNKLKIKIKIVLFCIHCSINWSANIFQGINISACISMNAFSYIKDILSVRICNQLKQLCKPSDSFMCLRSSLYAVVVMQ